MVVQFEEEKVLGRPYCVLNESFQYLKGTYKEDGENLFSRSCCNRTRGMVLKEGRFSLAIERHFFAMRVVKHWYRLSRDVVDTSSLETFKVTLDWALRNPI